MTYLHGDYHQGPTCFSGASIGRQCIPNCAICRLCWNWFQ